MRPPKSLGETMSMPVELGFESPYSSKEHKRPAPMEGTVVYIHPQRRWFTLEFRTPHGSFRESYGCVPEHIAFCTKDEHVGWRRLQSAKARPEDFLPGPVPRYRSDCK